MSADVREALATAIENHPSVGPAGWVRSLADALLAGPVGQIIAERDNDRRQFEADKARGHRYRDKLISEREAARAELERAHDTMAPLSDNGRSVWMDGHGFVPLDFSQGRDLLDLARMYGEACGRLIHASWHLEACAEAAGHSPLMSFPVSTTISRLATRIAELEAQVAGWKSVAVIAAIPLEAMRMAGSYRALAPSTQACVDEAVVAIRMAVGDGLLPPEGDVGAALAPARAVLASPDRPETGDRTTEAHDGE